MTHTPLLKDAIDYHIKTGQLGSSSLESYAVVRKSLSQHALLDLPLDDFNGAIMKEWLASLQVSDTTRFTIYYTKVRTSIRVYCADHNLKVPLSLKTVMKMPKLEQEDKYLTLDEVKAITNLDFSQKTMLVNGKEISINKGLIHSRDLFLAMCWSGMAIADLQKFNPSSCLSKDGATLIYHRQKSVQRCTVMVFPEFKAIIDRNVWPMKRGRKSLQDNIKIIGKMIGRPEISSHYGRKTFATLMITLGVSMEVTSKMMGHTNMVTTQKFYASITESKMNEEAQRAVEKLNEINQKS